jgi:hypothetical protein
MKGSGRAANWALALSSSPIACQGDSETCNDVVRRLLGMPPGC